MRDHELAEALLSRLTRPGEASSLVGDLIETESGGRLPFWRAVLRSAFSLWQRNLLRDPVRVGLFVLAGWFVYMTIGVLVAASGGLLAPFLTKLLSFVAGHTGLELIVGLPGDGSREILSTAPRIEWLLLVTLAPFLAGRLAARCWPPGALTAWGAAVLAWPVFTAIIPFAAVHTRVDLPMILPIQLAAVIGIFWPRAARPA